MKLCTIKISSSFVSVKISKNEHISIFILHTGQSLLMYSTLSFVNLKKSTNYFCKIFGKHQSEFVVVFHVETRSINIVSLL